MQAEPNEAATEPSAEGRKRSTDEILRECLVHHLYREGLFEIGDCLVREGQMPPEYGRLKEPYLRLFELLATLRAQNIEPCLQWARERRELLGDSGLRLEFELARLHYVQLLLAGQAQAALAFAQNAFPPFTGPFEPEIQTLMGCLAFAGRLETSPYTTFLHQDFLSTTVGLLSAAYCKSMKLPQEPAFSQWFALPAPPHGPQHASVFSVKLGTLSLPKINRVMAMMKERKGIAWSQQDELPVEIELAQNLRHHSVFVCPVLKQQATAGNPPMMMPCGHVICLEALTRLSKGNNFVYVTGLFCHGQRF